MDFELRGPAGVLAAAAEVLGPRLAAGKVPAAWESLWQALAKAGLLALALPGWMGGDGLSVLEAAVLLTELGRRASPVPALATIMLGALPSPGGAAVTCAGRAGRGGGGETLLTAGVREPPSRCRGPGHPPRAPCRETRRRELARHRLRNQDRRAVRRGGALDPVPAASPRAAPGSCWSTPRRRG